MHVFKVGLIGVALALSGAMAAQAAVLPPVNVDCFLGFIRGDGAASITGTVGDTVVIKEGLSPGGSCSAISATAGRITGSATIANNGSQTYTLAAAGTGTITITSNFGGLFTIPFTVTAAPVATTNTVPTLSEYAMIALASLIAMGGVWTMRKRGKL